MSASGHPPQTTAALIDARAHAHGRATALRQKRYGIWHALTWAELQARARQVAQGLRDAGLQAGDRVALLADNSVQAVVCELGIGLAGAIPVCLYPTLPAGEIVALLGATGCRGLIFDSLPRLDKVQSDAAVLERLRLMVAIDARTLQGRHDPRMISYDALAGDAAGRHPGGPPHAPSPGAAAAPEQRPDDLALIAATSGATGAPRPVFLSHRNLIQAARALAERVGIGHSDAVVSVLPLGSPVEQVLSIYVPLLTGMIANFSESARTMQADIREIGPTVLVGPPRLWQKLQVDLRMRIQRTGAMKRALLNAAVANATLLDAQPAQGRSALRRVRRLCDTWALFVPLKRHFGFNGIRFAASTGAAEIPSVTRFLRAIGMDVRDAYSLAASSGIVAMTHAHAAPAGACELLPGMAARTSPHGEIQMRGDQVSVREAGQEGWLATGDRGDVTASGLRVLGRMTELHGAAAQPQAADHVIEAALKADPLIREAVVVHTENGTRVAAIQADAGMLGIWASQHQFPFTGFRSLITLPAVANLLDSTLKAAAAHLPAGHRLSGYVLLDEELSVERGELSPLMVARRQSLAARLRQRPGEVRPLRSGA